MKDYVRHDEQSINIYAFAGLFSPDVIEAFEKQYGIRVSLKFFESNEELLAKFEINKGKGYDLITPTDYTVELLAQQQLLTKLDHAKLPVFKKIDQRLCNRYFDPSNDYSIPLGWIVYGFLFNKKIFKQPPVTLGLELLFKDPKEFSTVAAIPYRISMKDDCRDAVLLSAIYLFDGVEDITKEKMATIENMLVTQKGWVENYLHQDIGYFFMADIIHLAVTDSSYAKKIMEESDDFDFILPRQGSVMAIENMAIPKNSNKVELVYKFINFVLSRESSIINMNAYGLNPSNTEVYEAIDRKFTENPNFFPTNDTFKKLHLTHNKFPLKQLEQMWLKVKGI